MFFSVFVSVFAFSLFSSSVAAKRSALMDDSRLSTRASIINLLTIVIYTAVYNCNLYRGVVDLCVCQCHPLFSLGRFVAMVGSSLGNECQMMVEVADRGKRTSLLQNWVSLAQKVLQNLPHDGPQSSFISRSSDNTSGLDPIKLFRCNLQICN